jgi:hypothetical protein
MVAEDMKRGADSETNDGTRNENAKCEEIEYVSGGVSCSNSVVHMGRISKK